MVGCGSSDVEHEASEGYDVYNGDGFSFDYPSDWVFSQNEETGLISLEDLSGTPALSFSSLSGDFGMAGWEMQKNEVFIGEGGVEFSLTYNKIDADFIAEGYWPEGQKFIDNDTTFVMISTEVVANPMFYEFDKTDPEGEDIMRSILNSFYTN